MMVQNNRDEVSFIVADNLADHLLRMEYPNTSEGWVKISLEGELKWPRTLSDGGNSLFVEGNENKTIYE